MTQYLIKKYRTFVNASTYTDERMYSTSFLVHDIHISDELEAEFDQKFTLFAHKLRHLRYAEEALSQSQKENFKKQLEELLAFHSHMFLGEE